MEKINIGDATYSITQIETYLSCPRKYYLRYIQGIEPDNQKQALVFGKNLHKALEENFSQKINTGVDLAPGTIADIFAHLMEESRDSVDWNGSFDKELNIGVKLLKMYREEAAPQIKPIKVEYIFTVDIAELSRKFSGVIDLIEKNMFLIDFKTASRVPSPPTLARYFRQLCAYSYGMICAKNIQGEFTPRQIRKINSLPAITGRIDLFLKQKEPKIQCIDNFKINETSISQFLALVREIDKAIKNNVFVPNMNNYFCSPKYCDYWNICKEECLVFEGDSTELQ